MRLASRGVWSAGAALAALAGLLMHATVFGASQFVVDSTADEPDAAPLDARCLTAAGTCTLRAAVQAANELPGVDTVVLPAGTYVLTLAGAGEEHGLTGDLDVRESLILRGAGDATTVLDAGQLDRALHVLNGAVLELSGVTVRNGSVQDAAGGGIYNAGAGNLTLTGVTLSANRAIGVDATGGGLATEGPAQLTGARLEGNFAEDGGGGLAVRGAVTLRDTNVTGNQVTHFGGGVAVFGPTASLSLVNSRVVGNKATVDGGGVYNGDADGVYAGAGTLTLLDVTVDGNRDTFGGAGGILTFGPANLVNVTVSQNTNGDGRAGGIGVFGGTASLTNVTVSRNTGYSNAGGIYLRSPGQLELDYGTVAYNEKAIPQSSAGAGIETYGPASARLKNTIVAYNRGASPIGEHGNCSGGVTSLGNNHDSALTCGFAAAGDMLIAEPLLGPLKDNGGPTWTHELLDGSDAIDAGSCTRQNGIAIASDQRGVSRPQDGTGDGNAACDVGAFERGAPPTITPTNTPSATVTSTPTPTATASPTVTPTPGPVKLSLPLLLRPAVVVGGDFEDGLGGWTLEAAPLPVGLATDQHHSPTRALLLGDRRLGAREICEAGGIPLGAARASRRVLMPDRPRATLSFWYRVLSQDKTIVNQGAVDALEATVDGVQVFRGGYEGTEPASCGAHRDVGWRQAGVLLEGYGGRTVTLAFELWSREPGGDRGYYNTYAYVDDVLISPN
jgi:CSLREA domain-containing protein